MAYLSMADQETRPDARETSMLEMGGGLLGMIPGVGTVMNLGNMAYHGGSAIYDGLHGDRDGAVAHGVQAAMSGLGAIPAVGDAIQGADVAMMGVGTLGRMFGPEAGIDPSQIPGSVSDLAASAAVMGTNAIFGADDSNWIAEGDKPTGTRAGEIQAGADVLGYITGGPLFGGEAADFLKPLMTDAGEFFGSDLAGPTSGVRGPDGGSYAQKAGDFLHSWDWDRGQFGTPEFGPPIEVPVGPNTLPVAPDEGY